MELMVACAILGIMLSAASVDLVRVKAVQNAQDAKMRLRQVAQAVFAVNYCSIPANACNAAPLAATLPAPGSVVQQFGYTFTQTTNADGTWTFVAVPIAEGFSGQGSFFISGDAILRCGITATAGPC
jgi:type II secretory pathway pseudopilin PulG